MTISDKRKEIVRGLRLLAETPDEIDITEHAVIHALGVTSGFYDDCCKTRDVVCLADLIDRPTCNNVSEFGHNTASSFDFVCGNCGSRLIGDGMYCSPLVDDRFSHYGIKFCPNCGAEVVE